MAAQRAMGRMMCRRSMFFPRFQSNCVPSYCTPFGRSCKTLSSLAKAGGYRIRPYSGSRCPSHVVGAIHESPGKRGSNPMGGGRFMKRPYDYLLDTEKTRLSRRRAWFHILEEFRCPQTAEGNRICFSGGFAAGKTLLSPQCAQRARAGAAIPSIYGAQRSGSIN